MELMSPTISISLCLILLCSILVKYAAVNAIKSVVSCDPQSLQGMPAMDCTNRQLKEVPKNLPGGIEVLDLSNNRFRILHNDSFERYTGIKFLYLSVNSIYKIESSTFKPLSNLQVLDLSENTIAVLDVVFPSTLYRLYLTQNPLTNFSFSTATGLLSLSLAECEFQTFPSIGVTPSLVELNISGNPLKTISASDLAPLCNLKMLHVDNVFTDRSNKTLCECAKFERWVTTHEIKVSTFRCNVQKTVKLVCDTEPNNATMQSYSMCQSEWQFRQIPIALLTGCGILAAIIGLAVIIYLRCIKKTGPAPDSPVKYYNSEQISAPLKGAAKE